MATKTKTRRTATADATPAPARPTAPTVADILAIWKAQHDYYRQVFERTYARLVEVVSDPSRCLADALGWDARSTVEAQQAAETWRRFIGELEDRPEGRSFRDHLAGLVAEMEAAVLDAATLAPWDRNSSNPVANLLDGAKATAGLKATAEIVKQGRHYLAGDIDEGEG